MGHNAIDLETGAIVGVTVQDADDGDTTTMQKTAGRIKPLAVIAAAVVLPLLTSGCQSNTSPSFYSGRWCDSAYNEGTMSATIDGTVWTASRAALPSTPTPSNNGAFELNGSDCVHFLSIWASGVNGPGTYPVTLVSYSADTSAAGPTWVVDSTGGSGSVTVTALTGTGLAGTNASGSFALSLAPRSGASGTKVITNGSFNISF